MIEDVLKNLRSEMEGTLVAMKKDLGRLRTGRASASLLDGIFVEYYGARTALNQITSINVPEARLIVLQPFDRSAITNIERAIMQSDLGLMPINDGKIIRVPIPELTEERRRDLVKHSKKMAEEYRVSMRNHRRDAIDMMKELEADKQISEDDFRKGQEKVQEITKEYSDRLEKILKQKEDEIMEV